MYTTGADFTATLIYYTTEQGGRKTFAQTGYRPQLKFSFATNQTSGMQHFIGKEIVSPGDTVDAEITMLSPHLFYNCLTVGTQFEFREGDKIIGTGIITAILNTNILGAEPTAAEYLIKLKELNKQTSIRLSKLKILQLVGICLLFIGMSAWLLWYTPKPGSNPLFNNAIVKYGASIAGILLGVVGFCYYTYKLTDNKPGLIVGRTGITDNSSGTAVGFIPWADVKQIYEKEVYRKKFIMIALHNPQEYIDRQTNMAKRKIMQLNFSHYGSPIFIQSNTLNMEYEEINDVLHEYFAVYKTLAEQPL